LLIIQILKGLRAAPDIGVKENKQVDSTAGNHDVIEIERQGAQMMERIIAVAEGVTTPTLNNHERMTTGLFYLCQHSHFLCPFRRQGARISAVKDVLDTWRPHHKQQCGAITGNERDGDRLALAGHRHASSNAGRRHEKYPVSPCHRKVNSFSA
jgi:hypothetical protein